MPRNQHLVSTGLAVAATAACVVYFLHDRSGRDSTPVVQGSPNSLSQLSSAGQTQLEPAAVNTSLGEALALPFGLDRRQKVERAAYELTLMSAESALLELDKIQDASDRGAFLRGMFTAAAQLNDRDAIGLIKRISKSESLNSKSVGEYDLAMRTLAEAWHGGAPFPPQVVYVGKQKPLSPGGELGRWIAGERLDTSVTWANELLDGRDRSGVLANAAVSYAVIGDSSRALEILGQLSGEDHPIFLEQFGAAFASAPFTGLKLARNLPENELRTVALVSVCEILGNGGAFSTKFAYNELPTGLGRIEAIGALVQAFMCRSPEEAKSWAESLPADDRIVAIQAIHERTKKSPGSGP
jgi:hypothetical protein